MPEIASGVTIHCSFCGKKQDEVKKLVAGPTVYICDECIFICWDIMREAGLPVSPDAERILRASAREEAEKKMLAQVDRILRQEDNRRAPYEELRQAREEFRVNQEPPGDAILISLEKTAS